MPLPLPLTLLVATALVAALPQSLRAQASLGAADSSLVARILLAEDRRDSTDAALAAGAAHTDARVRDLARRARERIVDPAFARRDSLGAAAPAASPQWPEPAWKARYRAIATARDDCAAMQRALRDPEPAVRLRAADLLRAACAAGLAIITELQRWVDQLPPRIGMRRPGTASWHEGAHAIVALARLAPASARPRIAQLATHSHWAVRQRSARAAALAADTATLLTLSRDADANVVEAAVEGLQRVVGHDADSVYLRLMHHRGAQVLRVAALALAGSADPRVPHEAMVAFERLAARANASERDARIALLAAAGRPAQDDRPPERPNTLATDAVALALGSDRLIEVSIAAADGGGQFTVRLRGDVAPLMAAQVLDLVRAGYYDGSSWHRAELDFVLQGGSPDANEYVGAARALVDELGTLPHRRGTIGMSTRGHDTGDAQWFINLRDNLRLGGDYTVFAEVVAGMDVVDRLLEGDGIARMREVSAPPAPARP